MKALLMHSNRDFDFERELPPNEDALIQDLELDTLLSAMAAGDRFMFDVARKALLLSLPDPEAIVYRQQVVTDCLDHPTVVRELYALAGEALTAQKTVWWGLRNDSPRRTLASSVQKMELFSGFLGRLHAMAEEHASKFSSPGFTRLFAMLREELDDAYLELVDRQLKALKFPGGMLMSAQLAAGNRGKAYTLRRSRDQGFLGRIFDRSGFSFTIPDRDVSGFNALGTLEDRGTNVVSNALAQSVDHVDAFFVMLRTELAFYVACLNLSERLAEQGESTTFPVSVPRGKRALSARGLYDVCLALTTGQRVVGNDVDADGKSLVMITGANQGGKSTLLRSVGLAQLMTQAGMFVGAQSLRVNVCDGVFTHYKREEDETMESGKLDEELARMSAIADQVTANCILLCNESFASTNEREGSQIARQVVRALLDEGVDVVFVTHMFDLADGFHRQNLDTALFLRAERRSDGERPYKLSPGAPLPTSYGEDSYRKIFGASVETAQANQAQDN